MTDWLRALTLSDIILALVALGGLIGGLRYLGPILRSLSDFLADWINERCVVTKQRVPLSSGGLVESNLRVVTT